MDKTQITANFQQITSSTKAIATKYLKKHQYNIELAINDYYQGSQSTQQNTSGLEAIFKKYATDDVIDASGTESLLNDLEVDPNSITTTAIFYLFKSPSLYEFTKEGFIAGLVDLNVNSIEDLKSKIKSIERDLEQPEFRKKVYSNVFLISRPENQKSLDLETALVFWDMFCSDFAYLEQWKEFLSTHSKKPISKDTWNLFWDFQLTFKGVDSHDTDGISV